MLLFKQRILNYYWFAIIFSIFYFSLSCFMWVWLTYPLSQKTSSEISIICILFFAIHIPLIVAFLILLDQVEWYLVYDDRIVVRDIYGPKNEVYYKDIVLIEEKKYNMAKHFVIHF